MNGVTLGSYEESRFNKAYAVFSDTNYSRKTIQISYGDKTHSLFRLEPERTHYRATADSKTSLDYAFGRCNIELEFFDGIVVHTTTNIVVVSESNRIDQSTIKLPDVNQLKI